MSRCQNGLHRTQTCPTCGELLAGEFRRDDIPRQVCSCGCGLARHRIDLKTQPCDNCAECRSFTLAALHWRETRTVVEQVKP